MGDFIPPAGLDYTPPAGLDHPNPGPPSSPDPPPLQGFLEFLGNIPGPNGDPGTVPQDPGNGDGQVPVPPQETPTSSGTSDSGSPVSVQETVWPIACYEFHYFDLVCGSHVSPAFFGGYYLGKKGCPSSTDNPVPPMLGPGDGSDACYSTFISPDGPQCVPKTPGGCTGTTAPKTPSTPQSSTPPPIGGQGVGPGGLDPTKPGTNSPEIADLPENTSTTPIEVAITFANGSGASGVLDPGEYVRLIGNGMGGVLVGKVGTIGGSSYFTPIGGYSPGGLDLPGSSNNPSPCGDGQVVGVGSSAVLVGSACEGQLFPPPITVIQYRPIDGSADWIYVPTPPRYPVIQTGISDQNDAGRPINDPRPKNPKPKKRRSSDSPPPPQTNPSPNPQPSQFQIFQKAAQVIIIQDDSSQSTAQVIGSNG